MTSLFTKYIYKTQNGPYNSNVAVFMKLSQYFIKSYFATKVAKASNINSVIKDAPLHTSGDAKCTLGALLPKIMSDEPTQPHIFSPILLGDALNPIIFL